MGFSSRRKDNGSEIPAAVHDLEATERDGPCKLAHGSGAVEKEPSCKVSQDIEAVEEETTSVEIETKGFDAAIFKVWRAPGGDVPRRTAL